MVFRSPPLCRALACLAAVTWLSCSDSSVVEKPLDRIIIRDQDARDWDITQAVYRYGFVPDKFLFGLGAFVVRPIVDPPVATASDTTYPDAGESFTVVGVVVGNRARAYRITDIQSSEVVDDVLGGLPLAVFHSPLAGVTSVYERVLAGDTLTLSASGWVYDRRSVLFDYETQSMWYPIAGTSGLTCIAGAHFESRLPSTGHVVTTWNAWTASHPGTGFMLLPIPPPDSLRAENH